jgi:hypothetical protein
VRKSTVGIEPLSPHEARIDHAQGFEYEAMGEVVEGFAGNGIHGPLKIQVTLPFACSANAVTWSEGGKDLRGSQGEGFHYDGQGYRAVLLNQLHEWGWSKREKDTGTELNPRPS